MSSVRKSIIVLKHPNSENVDNDVATEIYRKVDKYYKAISQNCPDADIKYEDLIIKTTYEYLCVSQLRRKKKEEEQKQINELLSSISPKEKGKKK